MPIISGTDWYNVKAFYRLISLSSDRKPSLVSDVYHYLGINIPIWLAPLGI